MNPTHEQLLARLQQDAADHGAAPEDVDAHIAEALGVPLDYYFAYLLVAGALDGHHEAAERQTALTVDAGSLRADADPAGLYATKWGGRLLERRLRSLAAG